ncbi:hypothetical protein AZF08_06505 [Bacillus gaemokensis]|nr:hypothetical protein AZF08_06505 [Bacillus gaemokensis]
MASIEGVKWPKILAVGTGYILKAQVARPECEGDGASDREMLFASQEDVKPPTILASQTDH